MSKGLYLKIGGVLMTSGSGIALAVLPNIIPDNWNFPIFTIGIIGIVIGFIAIWLGVKVDKTETINALQEIKNDLIILDKYEKEAARKKDILKISSSDRDKIKSDLGNYITNTGEPLLMGIASTSNKEQILDNIIKFFVGIADIFDSNNYGIKRDLVSKEYAEYNIAQENIAKKQLQLSRRKRVLRQKHIHQVMLLTYGLNSVIIFRNLYRLSPGFRKAMPVKYNMMLESVEREGRKFLRDMLENLDKDWRKIIKMDSGEV